MSIAIITNKGLAVLAKLSQGNTLNITSAKTGAGTVGAAVLQEQTAVTTPMQPLTIKSVSDQGNGMFDIVLSLINEGLESSYAVSQIGIFAEDPDEGEVLYCIYQAEGEDRITIPTETVLPGYNAEWTFRLRYDQADSVNVTLDPANTVSQAVMEAYVSQQLSGANIKSILDSIEIVTTTGTGAAYIASVPGITALKAGVAFTMVPHTASTTNQPTLNVNGLGEKNIRQPLTSNTGATTTAASSSWLTAGKPVRVRYDGTLWEIDIPRPSATALYGSVPVPNGGTGLTSVTAGNFLVGNGTEDMAEKTPAEVLAAIGAAKSGHTHSATYITSGTFGVPRGGTGKSSVTAGSFLVGNGTSAMEEKTPAEVLAAIGGVKLTTKTVTLPASGWSSKAQTVSVSGVTASNTVFAVAAPASYSAYVDNGVRMNAQSSGKLTFKCDTTPTENITVNVAIFS